MNALTLAATNGEMSGGSATFLIIVYVAVIVLMIASLWKIFTKANVPGWACLIPFYNIYKTLKIIGRPGWWLILYFIPFVNIVVHLIVAIDLAKVFGKSDVFGIFGLWLFSIIGYPMLAFGEAKYQGVPQR